MSLSSSNKYTVIRYTGLQLQTATSTACIPLVWGANRVAPNIIWYNDFSAKPNKTKGKGGGKETTSYNYSASLILALTQGPISGIGTTYQDQSTIISFSSTGFTLFLGTDPQAVWSYLTSKHPTEAMNYNGVAYVARANYGMGTSPTLPSTTFELLAMRLGSQVGGDGKDADCALVVEDFVSNDVWGVGIPSTVLDNLLSTPAAPTTGDSAFQTYCQAMGFGFSPALTSQENALTVLDRWTQMTNTACYWSGYALRFVPYGDEQITANGVTYLPPTGVVYDLTDTDYHREDGADPILISRTDIAEAYNSVNITIRDRSNNYNDAPITLQDQNLVELYGVRQASAFQASEVCVKSMAAIMVQLYLQRKAYIRNTYQFTLTWEYCLLEPMDVVTLTDLNIGLSTTPVRITGIDEDDQGMLKFTCEEFTQGLSSAGGYATQQVTNTPQNSMTVPEPVNPPIIFEPQAIWTQGVAEVWVICSGGNGTTFDPFWGGCQVWISTDGTSYNQIGEIETPGIQGVLTANLAAYGGANPDTTHTLSVSTAMSNGELIGGTSADAANGMLLSYVDGELISFETATLTGTDAYDLTTIYRGLYGTTAGSHSAGTKFGRIDSSTFKYQLPPQYIGQTLYFKFPSFNIWGNQLQDLSTCTAYSYTPVGTGFGGGSGGVPTTPTGLAAGVGSLGVSVTWNANPITDNVQYYGLYRATGIGASFGSASLIATINSLSEVDVSASGSTGYTYFLVAHNVIGDSSPTSGVNVSGAIATGALWGFGFEKDLGLIVLTDPLVDFTSEPSWIIPKNMPLSSIKVTGTGPTSTTDFDLQVNSVSVGTIRFTASSTTATFIKAADTTVPTNGIVQIWPPSSLNGISGRMYGSIAGPRQ